MPRKEINYQNTVIYKIQHIEKEDLLYVGHTTDFVKRKNNHKSKCTKEGNEKYNLKLYHMIRENGGWEMFKMIEIKKYPCNDQREACAEEDKQMKELKVTMNSCSALFDREKLKVRQHKSDAHRNSTIERLNYKKDYYQANKDKIDEQKRIYDVANKDKIKAWRNEIVTCECGCKITRKTRGLTKHKHSQRHKDGIETIDSNNVV
jgi:hypothetical protein